MATRKHTREDTGEDGARSKTRRTDDPAKEKAPPQSDDRPAKARKVSGLNSVGAGGSGRGEESEEEATIGRFWENDF